MLEEHANNAQRKKLGFKYEFDQMKKIQETTPHEDYDLWLQKNRE